MKKLSLLALVAVILTAPACWRKKEDGCSTCCSSKKVVADRESGPMQAGVQFEDEDLK